MRNPNLTSRRIPSQSELWSRLEELDLVPEKADVAEHLAQHLSLTHTRKNVYIAILEEENYLLETLVAHNREMANDAQDYPRT
jgi:hypothetical protein